MTKRHLMALRLMLMLADGVAAAIVFIAVSALRFTVGGPMRSGRWALTWEPLRSSSPQRGCSSSGPWGFIGSAYGGACWRRPGHLARATVVVVAVTLSALFLLHQDNVSRIFLALLFVVQPAVSLTLRAVLRSWFDSLRQRGYKHELHAGRRHWSPGPGVRRPGRDPAARAADCVSSAI